MLECELQTVCSQTYDKKIAVEKVKLQGNVFLDSQFNSAPLIWMFCQKTLYLNTLRIIHQSNASYRYLLECNGSASFCQVHL